VKALAGPAGRVSQPEDANQECGRLPATSGGVPKPVYAADPGVEVAFDTYTQALRGMRVLPQGAAEEKNLHGRVSLVGPQQTAGGLDLAAGTGWPNRPADTTTGTWKQAVTSMRVGRASAWGGRVLGFIDAAAQPGLPTGGSLARRHVRRRESTISTTSARALTGAGHRFQTNSPGGGSRPRLRVPGRTVFSPGLGTASFVRRPCGERRELAA